MRPSKTPAPGWWTEYALPWTASFGRSLALVLGACLLVLALAAGRGALATTISLIRRQLPYADSGRLLALWRGGFVWQSADAFSARLLRVWKNESRTLERISAFRWETFRGDGFRRAPGARVAPDFFQTLGVRAEIGRVAFGDREIRPVALSHAFWREHFGQDAGVLGKSLELNGEEFRVVGVLPRDFWFVSRQVQLWTPADLEPPAVPGAPRPAFGAIVRLKPAVPRLLALQELQAIGGHRLLLSPLRLSRIEDELLRGILPILLFAGYAFLLVALIGAVDLIRFACLPDRPDALRRRTRFVGFLLVKSLAALAVPAGLWLVLMDPGSHAVEWGGGESLAVGFWLFGLAMCGAVYWSLLDQRYRCRVCLRRLRMPVPTGSWSTPLLDRPGTEYICAFGHGKLHVASMRLLGFEPARWTYFGDFWKELTQQEHAAREE